MSISRRHGYPFALLIVLVPFRAALAQEVCKCIEFKAPQHYYRYSEKHETHLDRFPTAKDTLVPADMIAWEKRYAQIRIRIKTRPLDQPRVSNTPEDTLYVLKGFMWFIKHEKNGVSRD